MVNRGALGFDFPALKILDQSERKTGKMEILFVLRAVIFVQIFREK